MGFKVVFVIAIVLALTSAAIATASTQGINVSDRIITPAIIAIGIGIPTAILVKKRAAISYKLTKDHETIEIGEEFAKILGIKSITPHGSYVIVEDRSGRKVGHAYFKITNVPYLVDELDQQRKVFVVGNFVRSLSTLTFPFELIPRIMPISREAYMGQINKQINDLKLTLSAEAGVADPARQARLKNLEKIATRLLEGEGVRDVSFLVHIIAYGKEAESIARELQSNTKTLMSTLEMGLSVKAEKLTGQSMLDAIKEFFRASVVRVPSKPCRILCWDLAYLIPLAKPKLPPIEKLLSGPYLGRTTSGAVVCLDIEKYSNPHMVILGQTGAGKSVTAKSFASRFYDLYGTSVLCIDFAGEYADWVRSRGGKIIDMSRNVINPFELGPATLTDRIRQLVDAFEKICGFNTINQRNAFTLYLSKAYNLKGYRPDDPLTWKNSAPDLGDVIRLMEEDMPKLHQMMQLTVQSLLDRLRGVAGGAFGIFGKTTVTMDELTKGFTCIDLSKVTSDSLTSILAWTVLQYVDSKMKLNGVVKGVKLLIILDEAWKTAKSEDSLPVRIIKEGRKWGYAILASSQDQGVDFAESILSNAGTVIIHRTVHPKYLNFCKHAYGLSEQEVSRIPNLEVGEALVKLGDDPRPFFVKVDMEEAEQTVQPRHTNTATPSATQQAFTEFTKPIQTEIQSVNPQINTETNYQPEQSKNPVNQKVSGNIIAANKHDIITADALRLLRSISQNPELRVTEHYAKLNLNNFQGDKAKNILLERGLASVTEVPRIEGKGRWGKILTLTYSGRQQLGLKNNSPRFGGTLHEHIVRLLAEKFKAEGHTIEIEFPVGAGRKTDLVVDNEIAVEVETRDFREANIVKNIEAGFRKVVVACQTKQQQDKFAEKILAAKIPQDKVSLTTVSHLLKQGLGEMF